MNTKFYRIVAIVAAAFMLFAFTGCLMPSSNQQSPKVEIEESTASELDHGDRQLAFIPVAEKMKITVNTDTVVGYFCYKDNELRILTENTKSEKADDSIEYTVKIVKEDGSAASADEYECEIVNDEKSNYNGWVRIKSSVLGHVELSAKAANGSRIDVEEIAVAKRSVSVFDILLGAIGLYLLFAGIVGRGKLYESEFVKEGKEEKRKLIIRISCLVIGALMVANFVVRLLNGYNKDTLNTVNTVLLIAMIVAFFVAMALLRPCTDQNKKMEARAGIGGAGRKNSSAAFEFDEDEPTLDDIQK